MENFVLKGDDKPVFMPEIELNAGSGACYIAGESYLEEPFKLYESVLQWFKDYFSKEKGALALSIRLSYINSTSSRAILELLRGLKVLQESGHALTINWMYPSSEEDFNEIREEGEDFIDESGAQMNLVEYHE